MVTKPDADDNEQAATYKAFKEWVNMTPSAIEKFLETAESKEVGWTNEGEDESVGHKSGKRIVEILRKKKGDLSDDDYGHMAKVVGYIKRHMAQGGPKEDKEHSAWRYSLMNWGHDPSKD